MSTSVCNRLRFASVSLKTEERGMTAEKQGIVSILGSDCERTKAASPRRTLSADMSSKKWLAEHGFYPLMKKIASCEEFPVSIADSSSSSEGEEDCEEAEEPKARGEFNIWELVQSERKKKELEKAGQFDTWSSILAQKAEDSTKSQPLPPPYIHPLVKKSANSMSEKSLEICTESLGSETGSDGYFSSPPSEIGDPEENKEEEEEEEQREEERESQFFEMDEVRVVKYKILPPRSFPPPLPSLSRHDGPSLYMRSHRKNGRLVLEAISVPSQNCFRAQRQDGRLLLSFVNSPPCKEQDNEDTSTGEEQDEVEEFEDVFENSKEEKEETEAENDDDDDDDEDEEAEEEAEEVKKEIGAMKMGIVTEQPPKLSAGVINVHRSATMIEKLLGLANYRNTIWPPTFNEVVNFGEEEQLTPLPNSLPPPPTVARLIPPPLPAAAAASFNAYEYCWRNKPAATAVLNALTQQPPPLKNNTNKLIISRAPKGHEHQQLLLLRGGKADYLDTFLRRCKEPRRSVLIWEPYCIASS